MDIASLTSCPKRFQKDNCVGLMRVLCSLLEQNLPFDKVILNLNEDEYELLHKSNFQLRDERLDIHIVEKSFGNIRSFKKFIPTVKWYVENCEKNDNDRIYIFDDDWVVNKYYHDYFNTIISNPNYDTQNQVIGMRYNPMTKYVGRLDATQMPAAASSYPLKHFDKDFYENFNQELAEKFNFEDELYYCLYAKKKNLGGIVTNASFTQFMKELENNETTLACKYCGNFVNGNPCNPRTNEIYQVVYDTFGIIPPNYLLPYCIYDNT